MGDSHFIDVSAIVTTIYRESSNYSGGRTKCGRRWSEGLGGGPLKDIAVRVAVE